MSVNNSYMDALRLSQTVTNDITTRIKKLFDLRKYRVYNPYRNSITIQGKRNETYIYIRVEQMNSNIVLNFSNIDLDESIRRQGVFTNLVNELSKSNDVNIIKIGTVLTNEMLNWCKKHNFETKDNSDFYKVIR